MLFHDDFSQGFQSQFPGFGGSCFSFGFVGQVDIFQFCGIIAVVDAIFKFISELFLLLDRFQYSGFSFFQFLKFVVSFLYVTNGYFVQTAGAFFSVAADKRDRSSFVKQLNGILYLGG